MKICYVLPNLEKGGIPRVYEGLNSYFENKGYKSLTVLLHSGMKYNYQSRGKLYELQEIEQGWFAKGTAFVKRLRRLSSLLEQEKPDVLVGFGVAANILMLMSGFSGLKICTEHNIKSVENKQWGFYGKIYNILMRYFYKKADVVVALTDAMKIDLQDSYKIPSDKIQVIPNPILKDDIIAKSKELNTKIDELIRDDDFCLLCLGASEERKGHFQLLTILPSLLEINKKIKIIFLGGKGSDSDRMKSYIAEYKLEDNILFVDFDVNPYTWIKRADLMLMPSYYEGFPMSILESLALGTPVIATNCISGPKEILAENEQVSDVSYTPVKYGVLIPSWNTTEEIIIKEALHNAIVFLMNNQDEYTALSLASEQRANIYDTHLIGEKYERLITDTQIK